MGFIKTEIDYRNIRNIIDASSFLNDAGKSEEALRLLKDMSKEILGDEDGKASSNS